MSPTPARLAPTPLAVRLAYPAIAQKILAVVRTRVPESDAPDVVQATYLRALLVPRPPEDDAELLRLVATIARGQVADFHRSRTRRAARIADAAEPDEVAPDDGPSSARDLVEAREVLAWIEGEVERGNIPPELLRWSREFAAGATFNEIARREGKTASAVKVALHRGRKLVTHRWSKYVAAAALGALVVAMLYARRLPDEQVASPPVKSTPPSAPAPLDEARLLRQNAARACAAQKWGECLRDLDDARDRDPAGDAEPGVQAERAKATEALAKPPPEGRPPKLP